jgi:ABC-type glycerol-3-phosphate transport system substrate-binding protein
MSSRQFTRRALLQVLGGSAAAVFVAACAQGGTSLTGKPAEKADASKDGAAKAAPPKTAEKTAPEALKVAGANAIFWFNQPLQYEAFQGIINRFHEKQDKVKMDVVLVPITDVPTKLATAIAGGEPPDAVRLGGPAVNALFISNGHAAALDDWDSKISTYDWVPGIQQSVSRDEKMYAMPVNSGVQVLYLNTDLYQKVGLDPAKPPATFAEVLQNVEKFASAGGGQLWGHYVATAPNYQTGADFFVTPLWAFGGDAVSEDGKTVVLNSPGTVDALQWYKDLIDKKGMPVKQVNETQVLNDFLTGTVGSMFGYPALVARVAKADFKAATAQIPEGPQGRHSPLGFGSIMVLKNGKNRDAGWAFASFIGLDASNDAFWCMSFGQLPPRLSFREDPSWKEYEKNNPLVPPFVEAQKSARLNYFGPGAQEIGTEMGKAVEAVVFGQKAPKQAAEDAAKASQVILDRERQKAG